MATGLTPWNRGVIQVGAPLFVRRATDRTIVWFAVAPSNSASRRQVAAMSKLITPLTARLGPMTASKAPGVDAGLNVRVSRPLRRSQSR